MKVYALADLHLAFGAPEKDMQVFGPSWKNYTEKISTHWKEIVSDGDLVLIAGDICWAMSLEQALADLNWIDQLPGTKVISRGNHDYWWPSKAKLHAALPKSIHAIDKNALTIGDITIGGVRLWDSEEYSFESFIEFQENPRASEKAPPDPEQNRKIFQRDLERLKFSLSQLDPKAKTRIAMIHYPPIGADMEDSQTSKILEEFQIDICVFGHLHNVRANALPFGEKNGVRYIFTSADYLNFKPVQIY
ncbi:MAG: metallophosphoesterase [Candidatus Algichlamydia australiensis]|nr:metallophosphoesterase [Chlamydiales bacterium]